MVTLALAAAPAGCTGSNPGDDTADDTGEGVPTWDLAAPDPGEWPMFKRDSSHQGLAEGVGALTSATVCQEWETPVGGPTGRGNSGVAVGVVAGRPQVFVAVDGRCDSGGCTAETAGAVYALDGATGDVLWRFDLPDDSDADPYGILLADVDLDGRRELIVPSTDTNHLYAITTEDEGAGAGALKWNYAFGADERSETAPTAVDLDPDRPGLEIAFGTDQRGAGPVRFLLVGADGTLDDAVEIADRAADVGCAGDATFKKIDSSSPAVAVEGGAKRVFVGSWNGLFYAFGWDGGLEIAWSTELPLDDSLDCPVPKVRSSPVVADLDGNGSDEVMFGFMHRDGQEGDTVDRYHTASFAMLDAATGDIEKVEAGTGTWKSSASVADLDPAEGGLEVVAGRSYGVIELHGELAQDWRLDDFGGEVRGNRSSPALADIDGDEDLEVLIGIEADTNDEPGGLACFDGATGALEWRYDSGASIEGQTQRGVAASPAVADLDGDGDLEVVYLDRDGKVHALDDSCGR